MFKVRCLLHALNVTWHFNLFGLVLHFSFFLNIDNWIQLVILIMDTGTLCGYSHMVSFPRALLFAWMRVGLVYISLGSKEFEDRNQS